MHPTGLSLSTQRPRQHCRGRKMTEAVVETHLQDAEHDCHDSCDTRLAEAWEQEALKKWEKDSPSRRTGELSSLAVVVAGHLLEEAALPAADPLMADA